jgi:hypothetical protein
MSNLGKIVKVQKKAAKTIIAIGISRSWVRAETPQEMKLPQGFLQK